MQLDPGALDAVQDGLELVLVQLETLGELIELGEVDAAVLFAVLEQNRDGVHRRKYAHSRTLRNPKLNSLQTVLVTRETRNLTVSPQFRAQCPPNKLERLRSACGGACGNP